MPDVPLSRLPVLRKATATAASSAFALPSTAPAASAATAFPSARSAATQSASVELRHGQHGV